MFLIEVLLPVYDNEGKPQPRALFDSVTRELTDRFGGVTAFLRAPAAGAWKEQSGATSHDDIVIYEVMTSALDRPWWDEYRRELEARFRQQAVVVRASTLELL